jgi:hypothetical protein
MPEVPMDGASRGYRMISACFLFAFSKTRQNGPVCRFVVDLFAAASVALFGVLSGTAACARTRTMKVIVRDFYQVRIFPEEF